MEKVVKEKVVKEKVVKEKVEEKWSFYIIMHSICGATYAGVSPDPVKRLRKHNGEISGGAKYTLGKGSGWHHICLIHGFHTKIQALQFEWAVKHVPPRNAGGLQNRLIKLYIVLNKTNWTSKSPEASSVPLTIEWKINDNEAHQKIKNNIDRQVPSYIIDIDIQ